MVHFDYLLVVLNVCCLFEETECMNGQSKVAHMGQRFEIHWCTVTQMLSKISKNSPDRETR